MFLDLSSIYNISLRAVPDSVNDRLYSFFTPAQASNEDITYVWDFGDGSEQLTGAGNLVDHTFPQYNKTYKVTVTMKSSFEEKSNYILVTLPKPALHIQGTYIDNFAAFMPIVLGVNINDAEFQWDFGDGQKGVSSSKSPSIEHTYEQAGEYTVKVTMVSSLLAEPIVAELAVKIQNTNLSCGLISEAVADEFQLSYKYSASAFIQDTEESTILYKWVYDGVEQPEWKEAAVTNGSALIEDTKVYTSYQQERKVTLKLKKAADTQDKNIVEQTGIFIYNDTSYTISADSNIGLTKSFTVTSNVFPIKDAVYYWTFGDGSEQITNEPAVTYTYAQQGDKEVSVIVRSSLLPFKEYSAKTVISVINNVVNSIYASAIEAESTSADKRTYKFKSTVVTDPAGEPVYYNWTINGQQYSEQEPVITFKYGETVTASLTVTAQNDSSKTATAQELMLVVPVPELSITLEGGRLNYMDVVYYYEETTYTINAIIDGNNTAIENPHVEWDFNWRYDDRGYKTSDALSIVYTYAVDENGNRDSEIGRPIVSYLTIKAKITGDNLAVPLEVTKKIDLWVTGSGV